MIYGVVTTIPDVNLTSANIHVMALYNKIIVLNRCVHCCSAGGGLTHF